MLEVLGCWLAHGHKLDDVLELTPDQMHIGALAITTYKTSVVTAYMAPLSQVMESLVPGLKMKAPSVRGGLVGKSGGSGRRVALEEHDNASGGKTRNVDLTAVSTPEQRDMLMQHMQMAGLPIRVRRSSPAPASEAPAASPPDGSSSAE
jgi:hypothetical protein